MERRMTKQLKHIWGNKSGILFAWCISYIIVLFIPLIFGAVIYAFTADTIEQEVYRSNAYMLELTRESADSIITEIQRMNAEMSFDANIETIRKNEIADNERLVLVTNVTKKLNQYSLENNNIDELYLYLKKSDTVISTSASSDSATFFDAVVKNDTMNYREWLSLLNEYHEGDYVPFTRVLQNGRKEAAIAFFKTLPAKYDLYDMSSIATIVILVDQKKFLNILSTADRDRGCDIHILDKHGNTILTSSREFAVDWNSALDNTQAVKEIESNGTRYMMSHIQSKETGLIYAVTSPLKAFEERVSRVKLYTGISMILSLLFGSITIWILLKKNYNPVETLLESLRAVHSDDGKEIKNEFRYINRTIQSLTEKQREVDKKLSEQDKMLKAAFIENYLTGNFAHQPSDAEFLERTGYGFPYPKFRVLIYYMDNYEQLFPDEKIDAGERLRLAKLIVGNISEELLGNHGKVYICEVNSLLVEILNTKQEATAEIIECLENIQNIIYFNFDFNFTVSIGNAHDSIDGLRTSYWEAAQSLEYSDSVHEDSIILYEDMHFPKSYYYSLEKELQLIHFVKSGDSDGAVALLEQICNGTADDRYLSKLLIFDLMGTIMKLLNAIDDESGSGDEVIEKGILLLNGFDQGVTLAKMYETIRGILINVCGRFAELSQKNGGLAEQIQRYIAENYADPNLTIAGLGETFGKTSTYLSRLFKTQTEIGLLEYINQYRIEKAKELLAMPNQTVEQVAAAVGFENAKTFTRLFKKYTGTVPSKLRV